ncbi:MAG TPA: hypothetical protein VND97_00825 [Beijerinckiaceae bacterium]|nr:hypothetical protein [Beijerinckiaceae bacterium]
MTLLAVAGAAKAQGAPRLHVAMAGPAQTVFASNRDPCGANDAPDVNARAVRDARGNVVMFALHDVNRALRGPDLDHLKIDCSVAYRGHGDPDPAHYDDHSWIAALWTKDGETVSALVHHEYHANEHPGRCVTSNAMACWYNTIIEIASHDGARSFAKPKEPVVAAAPFRQSFDQTRHRGFFNPSNIVSWRGKAYFFASTTGWSGQPYGACLFASARPADPRSWRAFDGRAFSVHYEDPYAYGFRAPTPCAPIAPFGDPVGSIVRYRPSGAFLAVWQAKEGAGPYPLSGFYTASSRDLLHWSSPRLLMPGDTLYDDPCRSGGRLINYPSLLDPSARTRTFQDVGAHPWLYYVAMKADGCSIASNRVLLRRPLLVSTERGRR